MNLHQLRHYSATELIAAGVDVRTVAGDVRVNDTATAGGTVRTVTLGVLGLATVITVALALVPSIVEELNIPAALRVDLLDLKECMCRWPVGDPQDESFHFCGRQKSHGVSYCEHHARMAYQPVQARRRERRFASG